MRDRPVRFAMVGSGWRARFFWRMAHLMPGRFELTGVVTRTAERGAQVTAEWGVPTYRTLAELLAARRPELVVVCVPWPVTPEMIRELVAADVPVLAETPPAPDLAGLHALWADVGRSGLVQVAEHSPSLPAHQARARLVAEGVLGTATQVQISSTHLHHAVAVVRRLLGVRAGAPVTVSAHRFEAPLMDLRTRAGWTGDTEPGRRTTTVAVLDLGDERSAVYDFTDNQWRNPLRVDRLLVRGSHGELLDDRVTRWTGPTTVVTSPVVRTQSGVGQDMDGFDLEHLTFEGRVLYRNPFVGARLADDDVAVATLLDQTGAWVRGDGPPPYPLAEGSTDHAVAMAIGESARTARPVRLPAQPWR